MSTAAAEKRAWIDLMETARELHEGDLQILRDAVRDWENHAHLLCRCFAQTIAPILETISPTNESDNSVVKQRVPTPVSTSALAGSLLAKEAQQELLRQSASKRQSSTRPVSAFRGNVPPVSTHALRRVEEAANIKHEVKWIKQGVIKATPVRSTTRRKV